MWWWWWWWCPRWPWWCPASAFWMAALMPSWGSQSIEVRLLSSSEVIVTNPLGVKDEGGRLSNVACGGSPVGSLNGFCAAVLAQSWKEQEVYLLCQFIFCSWSWNHIWQRHTDIKLHIVFHIQSCFVLQKTKYCGTLITLSLTLLINIICNVIYGSSKQFIIQLMFTVR